jgi:glucose 1-dehydrogenase
MDIAGRNAIVTGGGHRVGKAMTLALAAAGANVFIHYNRSSQAAEETATEVAALGVEAAIGKSDLRDPGLAPALISTAVEKLGPVSILVNSASGFVSDTIEDVTLEGWRSTFDLSLSTPVFLAQAFATALPDGLDGAIVNVTDVKTATPYRTHFSYVVAKGALNTFTAAAAIGLAPRIRVNAVALGVILPPPGEDESYVERLAARLPLSRVGGTVPVAAAAIALIENDFVTGEVVRVDGGGHLV